MFGLSSSTAARIVAERLEAGRGGVAEAHGSGDALAGEAGALGGALERGERQRRLLE